MRGRCRGEKRRFRETGVKLAFLDDMDLYPGRRVVLWVSRSCGALLHANPNRGRGLMNALQKGLIAVQKTCGGDAERLLIPAIGHQGTGTAAVRNISP